MQKCICDLFFSEGWTASTISAPATFDHSSLQSIQECPIYWGIEDAYIPYEP